MPLSKEKIAELIAKKNTPKPRATGSRRKFDINDRTHQAWFALEHHLLDNEGNMTRCDNPDCIDPRDTTYGQTIVIINGQNLCRYCFLVGWLTTNPAQVKLDE